MTFLCEWLKIHIATVDRGYASHMVVHRVQENSYLGILGPRPALVRRAAAMLKRWAKDVRI